MPKLIKPIGDAPAPTAPAAPVTLTPPTPAPEPAAAVGFGGEAIEVASTVVEPATEPEPPAETPTEAPAAAPEPPSEPKKGGKLPRNPPKGATAKPAPAQPKATPNAPLDTQPEREGSDNADLSSLGESLEDATEYLNMLFMGDGGTGKTTNLADMARHGKVIVINAESGLKKRPLAAMGIPIKNLTLWPNREKGEVITYNSLEQLYWDIKSILVKTPGAIFGVIMDSVTDVHIEMLKNIRDVGVQKAKAADKERDPFKTELQDYGVMTEQMRLLLRRFRDLPCHFGVSALQKRDKDDDGKVVYRSELTEKLGNSLHGYMDMVVVTTVTDETGVLEFIGLTTPAGKFRGKDRTGSLPAKMIDPTFTRIFEYVSGELTRENDEFQQAAILRRTGAPPEPTDDGTEEAGDAGDA